jgi:hypothetical protein
MQILGLLPYTILTLICQTTLDTSLTRSFITASQMSSLTGKAGSPGLLPPRAHGVFRIVLLFGLTVDVGAVWRSLAATVLVIVVATAVRHLFVVVVVFSVLRLAVVVLVVTLRHST